jgi:hypothetical protein
MVDALEKEDSVFDFLYVDFPRISLLLSSFGTDGVLTQLSRESTTGTGGSRGLDLKVAKLDTKNEEKSALTRTYDPQWLLPLLFLDKAHRQFQTKFADAALGQLVHTVGSPLIVDTSPLQALYTKPALQQIAIKKAMKQAEENGVEFNHDEFLLLLDAVNEAGAQVQMHFLSEGGCSWCTLRPEGLVTPAPELAMKHGGTVAGEWHFVGIKDSDLGLGWNPDQVTDILKHAPFASEAATLTTAMRTMFGRPAHFYGVTPLLIFRSIG